MTRALVIALCAAGCTERLYLGDDGLPADDARADAEVAALDAAPDTAPDASPDASSEPPALLDAAPDAARPDDLGAGDCGNGRVDPGETCATCPIDLAARLETANDEDDDCDGRVDEDVRIPLARLHCSNGFGCANKIGDWDHCFSLQPTSRTCFHAPGSRFAGGRCEDDRTPTLYVYPSSLGTTSTVPLRSGMLYRLWDCFHAPSTQHAYVAGDPAMDAQVARGYQCAPIGYAPVQAWPHGTTRRVYRHVLTNATDAYYDFLSPAPVVDPGGCVPEEENALWWAWMD